MNTRARTLIATTLLLSFAGLAQAGVAVLGGVTLPQENWDDLAEPGPHVGLEVGVPIIPGLLTVGGQGLVSLNSFDIEEDLGLSLGDHDYDGHWLTFEALAMGKLYVPQTGLHAKLGLGITSYRLESDDELLEDYESETHWVGAVGAGMTFTKLELGFLYHVVKWDDDAETPSNLDEVNRDYSYFTVSAALSF